ncbi:MAG: alpha/beta hydrolase [Deltaproteobacteria bacterium]|nr:alpha/beta hydrolase [Deltaproteobacteria bacterium]
MSHIIIGIHGLANKPPKEQHEPDWVTAIQEGLARNCLLPDARVHFDLIFWAHLKYNPLLTTDPEPYLPTPVNQPIAKYRDGWLSMARAYVSDIPGDMITKAREWLGVSSLTDLVLSKKLTDLGAYYREPDYRKTLRDLLKKVITDNQSKRITLIAHSMGSIIAYDALRELGRDNVTMRVDNFITIGSPLGIPTVAAAIHKEWNTLRTPSIVRRWLNFADPRDPVAIDTHLRNDYDANDQGVEVEDDVILNNYVNVQGQPNYHKIYGYLRCPEMSEMLRGIL